MLNEDNQIHNFISSSGSDFLTSYGFGSTRQKVTVPTVPVPVPQYWKRRNIFLHVYRFSPGSIFSNLFSSILEQMHNF
jgi:hypothetical protein